jgi:hypothetical protein
MEDNTNHRNFTDVLRQMLSHVPETESDFIDDLNAEIEDSKNHVPEVSWANARTTIFKRIGEPSDDWQWIVCAIFENMSVKAFWEKYYNS